MIFNMNKFTGYGRNNDIDFGDYVKIEQFRYGVPNEMYLYKVVGSLKSNVWTDTPIKWDSESIRHDTVEKVLNVICCGIDETKVITVRQCDVCLMVK